MPSSRTIKLGWENREWQSTLSLFYQITHQSPIHGLTRKRFAKKPFRCTWMGLSIPGQSRDTCLVQTELRHYLAHLARRSRCFSRCTEALRDALKLFMYCFNRRQLHEQRFPTYPAHAFRFVQANI